MLGVFGDRITTATTALEDWLRRRPVAPMLLILLGSVLAMLPTAVIAPIAWQDDSQMTDAGRVLLSGDASFGLSLLGSGEALVTPFVLGPLVSEAMFLLGGHLAVRAGSIGLAALCAYLLYSVGRRAAGDDPLLPALLALVLFFSYSFSQNFRSGRFDVLAFALTLLSVRLLLLRPGRPTPLTVGRTAASATALSLSMITWPTAVLLAPLWLVVLVERMAARDRARERGGARWPAVLVASIVPAVIVASVALLIVGQVSDGAVTLAGVAQWLRGPVALPGSVAAAGLSERAVQLGRSLVTDAALLAVPTITLLTAESRRRAAAWATALVVIAAAVVITNPYVHRYVYFAVAAALASVMLASRVAGRGRRLVTTGLLVLLPVIAAMQLLLRPALAVRELDDRSADAAAEAIAGITCPAGERVFLDAFRHYYTLRAAGCRADRLFASSSDTVAEHLLAPIDDYAFIVLSGSRADWELLVGELADRGWEVSERGTGAHYRAPIVVLRRPDNAG